MRGQADPGLLLGRRRLRLATVLVLSLFAVLGLRLVELQLTDGPAFAASGLQHRLTEVTLPAARGAIVDRHGATLAHSVEARFVYADGVVVPNGGPGRRARTGEAFPGYAAERRRQSVLFSSPGQPTAGAPSLLPIIELD